jgi:hypothetical protein
MNTYAKVIYLHFKKQLTIRDIAMVMDAELRPYDDFTYRGKVQKYPPIKKVQLIITNEMAEISRQEALFLAEIGIDNPYRSKHISSLAAWKQDYQIK